MNISHTLTITPIEHSDSLTARCECNQWAMVTPTPGIAIALHRCHALDTLPPTTTPRSPTDPPITATPVSRWRRRHSTNHPTEHWWNRHHP